MAESRQGRKGSFRDWLSKVFKPSQETEQDIPEEKVEPEAPIAMESPEPEAIELQEPEMVEAQEPEIVQEDEEPLADQAPLAELSDELQQFLAGNRFAPLREALKEDQIITVEQFRLVQLWVFLNRHNLYPIAERLSVFDYIQDKLNPETEVDEEPEYATEPIDETESEFEENTDDEELESELEPEVNVAPEPEIEPEIDEISVPEPTVVEPLTIPVEEKPTEPKDPAAIPYYELYPLDPDAFRTYPTEDCGFSVRVSNRLISKRIENVGELLEQSDAIMLSISGFGANSLKEIHAYFEKLTKSGATGFISQVKSQSLTDELIPFTRKLRSGDFSFVEGRKLSVKSQRLIEQFREAHEMIDPELIESIAKGEPAALAIVGMLEEFVAEHEKEAACKAAIDKIPLKRLAQPAEAIFRAFSNNEEFQKFYGEHSYKDANLQQFVFANADLVVKNNARMTKLLRWCGYNVVAEITEFFDNQLEKDRTRRVFCGRVRGDTLAQLGDELELTRERVRQIEAKVIRSARDWFLRNRVMHKIFLDFDEEASLSSGQIVDYVGQYGLETIAILKECSGQRYFYDERLDLFTLGKPIDRDAMQEYVDSLPDLFVADKLDAMIADGVEKYGYPEEQLRVIFDGSYRRTGDTYHRSRLTLAIVYGETMKKYYPNGIHIDDEEIERFKQLAQDEFGIDLSDKNTHSVSTIISRISILCGRGKYRLKSDGAYLSSQLVERIRDYVENSTTPIMLFSSIFTEFEDELRAEGVNNRYHLQGILKELFSDNWYFRKDYVTTDPEATSFYEAVGSFIAKATSPVPKEEVLRQFPGITDIVINLAVSGSDTINLFGSYINASRLTLSDSDIQYLHKKIEEALSAEEICYARDLYNTIRLERPGLLSRNYITAGFGLYSVLEYLFGNDYNFSRPFIAKEGAEIKSILSVLKEMVVEADIIEISDITSFASEHNYPIPSILDFADLCNDTHD